MSAPCKAAEQVCFHTAGRLARYGTLPVCLVLKDCREIANDIDHAENEPILRPHSYIRAMCIAGHRIIFRSRRQQFVHLRGRTNLGGSGIDSEDERENDRKQDCCVCAMKGRISPGHTLYCLMVNPLVTEKRRSHATNDDVDGNTKRNKVTRCEGMHAS